MLPSTWQFLKFYSIPWDIYIYEQTHRVKKFTQLKLFFLIPFTSGEHQSFADKCKYFLNKLFTPPTVGLALGLVIGLIPQVKQLFYYSGCYVLFPNYPSISPPLEFLASALGSLGDCGIFPPLKFTLIFNEENSHPFDVDSPGWRSFNHSSCKNNYW